MFKEKYRIMNSPNISFIKRIALIIVQFFIISLHCTAQDIRTIEYIKGDAILIDLETFGMLTVNIRFDATKDYTNKRILSIDLKAFEYSSGKTWDRVLPLLNQREENGWIRQNCKGYNFKTSWYEVLNGENTPLNIKKNMSIYTDAFERMPKEEQFTFLWALPYNNMVILW